VSLARRIDPWIHNNSIDAHVLDRKGNAEDTVVDEILELARTVQIILQLPYSVKDEINHPSTPPEVKQRAQGLPYTLQVPLTKNEISLYDKALSIVAGNAKPEKYAADVRHIVESDKYGGGYFLTNEKRLLKKNVELRSLVSVEIVTPTKFLQLLRQFDRDNLRP